MQDREYLGMDPKQSIGQIRRALVALEGRKLVASKLAQLEPRDGDIHGLGVGHKSTVRLGC
jgi:hypothetical protein